MRTTIKQKTEVVNYNVYIADDGKEFDSEEKCRDYELRKKELRVTCPECHGEGRFRGRFVPEYDNYDIGHVNAHYEYSTCQKCHGKGYLDKKVIETWE